MSICSIRILPHVQDTGRFFVAVFHKQNKTTPTCEAMPIDATDRRTTNRNFKSASATIEDVVENLKAEN